MKQLFQVLTLGVALLAVSCSKEGGSGEAPTQEQKITTKLDISMEVDVEVEELRNAMIVKPKTTPDWKLVLPTLKNGDVVPLKLVFSNGASLDHFERNFTYSDGKLRYAGEIAVTGYAASGNVTSRQWYVMAFLGGAKESNGYAYAPQVQPLSLEDQFTLGQDLNVPFVSKWTPVSRASDTKGHFSVSLKPMGYFMRVQVVNERDHELGVYGFQVESDKYWTNITFNPPYDRASLEAGAYPNVAQRGPNDIKPVGGNLLTKGGSGDGTKSRVFGIWVMPKSPTTTEETIKLDVVHRFHGGNWEFPFNVKVPATASGLGGNQGLKTLKVKNDHKIHRPLHTIDYVALGNLNASGTELAPTTTGALFVLERTSNADNRKYPVYSNPRPTTERLMTVTNWENVLPRSNPDENTHWGYNGLTASTDGDAFFRTGGSLTRANGDSFQFAGNVTYAVRTVDGHRAAFRYTLTPSTGAIKVEMVHLGTTSEGKDNIAQVSNDQYWQLAYRFGEVVTRNFAGSGVSGGITTYLGVYDKGLTALRADGKLGATLWNTAPGSYRIGIGIDEGGGALLQGHRTGRQVRQIHNKPLDLPANN